MSKDFYKNFDEGTDLKLEILSNYLEKMVTCFSYDSAYKKN